MTVRHERGIIPGIAPTPRHPREVTRREFLGIVFFGFFGAAAGLAFEESPLGLQVISKALGLSKAPIAGEVTAAIATSTPLSPTTTPRPTDTVTPIPPTTVPPTNTPEPTATRIATATATATVPAKPTLTAQERAEQLADTITISYPDANNKALVRNMLVAVLMEAPYGATAEQYNQTSIDLGMGDYLAHLKTEWGAKYPTIDFAQVINSITPSTPEDLLRYLTAIEEAVPGSESYEKMKKYNVRFSWRTEGWTAKVHIMPGQNYSNPQLKSGLFKEIIAPHIAFQIYRLNPNAPLFDLSKIGEELSFFMAAYYAQLQGDPELAKYYINHALKGGVPMSIHIKGLNPDQPLAALNQTLALEAYAAYQSLFST